MDCWCCSRTHCRSRSHRLRHFLFHAPQEEQERQPAHCASFWKRRSPWSHRIPAELVSHKPRFTTASTVLPKYAAKCRRRSLWCDKAGHLLCASPTVTGYIPRFPEPVRQCATAVAAAWWSAGVWCAVSVLESGAAECAARTI